MNESEQITSKKVKTVVGVLLLLWLVLVLLLGADDAFSRGPEALPPPARPVQYASNYQTS